MLMSMNRLLAIRIVQDRRLSASCQALYQAMLAHVKTTAKQYAAVFDVPVGSIRRCLAKLNHYGWAYSFRDSSQTSGDGRQLIYAPWMPMDVELEIVGLLEHIVNNAANRGETIMKMMLSLLVNDPFFLDNVRLRWTRLGTGHNRLEFDRYYPDARVAIEFQGRQHFQEVEFNHQKSDLPAQQIRDGLKALACLRQQVTLVEIADIDLSFETIEAKLTGHLPLLPIRMERPLFREIANLTNEYANWAREQRTRS